MNEYSKKPKLEWDFEQGLSDLVRINSLAARAWILTKLDGRSLESVAKKLGISWDNREDLGYLLREANFHLYWKHQGYKADNTWRPVLDKNK